MTNLLPTGYTIPETPSRYMRFDEGRNTFRVLGSAIVGWEYWIDNPEEKGKRKPVRVQTEKEIPEEVRNTKNWKMKAKHFWAFPVFNRSLQASDLAKKIENPIDYYIQVLEVTQKKVMKGIEVLVNDKENWGDPKNYDICVTRSNVGSEPRDVEYSVMPMPIKKLDQAILDTFKQTAIDVTKLFENGDPFADDSSAKLADEVAKEV